MNDTLFNIELIVFLLLVGGVVSIMGFVFFMFLLSFWEQ